MLNDVTTTYDNDNGNDDGNNDDGDYRRGGLLTNRNDNDDGGVGSDFNDELNEDDGRTQQVIWHGMIGNYSFIPSLYSR